MALSDVIYAMNLTVSVLGIAGLVLACRSLAGQL